MSNTDEITSPCPDCLEACLLEDVDTMNGVYIFYCEDCGLTFDTPIPDPEPNY